MGTELTATGAVDFRQSHCLSYGEDASAVSSLTEAEGVSALLIVSAGGSDNCVARPTVLLAEPIGTLNDDRPSGSPDALLPLSPLETALIRGFRRLPDEETRSSFVDVVREAIVC